MDDPVQVLNNILDYAIAYEVFERGKDIRKTFELFNTRYDEGIKEVILSNGKRLLDITPRNQPRTGISVKTFWNYHDTNKTDDEKIYLLAYLALKSIAGYMGVYKLKSKELVYHRMAGQPNNSRPIPEKINAYNTRYKWTKIREMLESKWGVVFSAAPTRGMIFSLLHKDREQLDEYLKLYKEAYTDPKEKRIEELRKSRAAERRKYLKAGKQSETTT